MPDKAFIDSNIIIYLYSEDEPDKRERCQQLVRTHKSIISTQVINEVSNVLYRKQHKQRIEGKLQIVNPFQ